MKKVLFFLAGVLLINNSLRAQGTLSGDFMMNANFFQRDTVIKAANNPLYDNYLSGGEAWLGLRYNYKGFTATLRADAFHNSNLYNPTQALSGFGIGAWSVSKDWQGLKVTAGYIYDQIGSGLLFRSYEDRGLLIDNALVGVHVKYQVTDNVFVKAFTGQQKFLFSTYKPIIKGFNAEGDFNLGDKVHILPGVGVINRTLDEASMQTVVSTINSQDSATRFTPKYNMYAFSAYNTLTVGDFSWYVEGAYKTQEAILKDNILQYTDGNIVFTTLGYARKGIAINLTGKRTENFVMRTSPNELLNRGMLNWQPIVARQRPQRLMARYTPASQDISEMGVGGDILLTPTEHLDIILNGTYINTLKDTALYREAYAEAEYRGFKNVILNGGVQYMQYNQERYQVKPAVPMVVSIIPFVEFTYRIDKKKSIRTEWEYQATSQDFGSWLFGLVEFNIAPKWSFSVSDMYNIAPGPNAPAGNGLNYYNIFMAFTKGPHRFTLAYVKQVEGINCTGGVCRYEPAFSGLKFGVTSQF
ncbi:MAG: hypothetical protein JST82_10975 [Bacteroidetes bacterium]|nr:hypothetical protein [Bacteroidota bacterium]